MKLFCSDDDNVTSISCVIFDHRPPSSITIRVISYIPLALADQLIFLSEETKVLLTYHSKIITSPSKSLTVLLKL